MHLFVLPVREERRGGKFSGRMNQRFHEVFSVFFRQTPVLVLQCLLLFWEWDAVSLVKPESVSVFLKKSFVLAFLEGKRRMYCTQG